MKNNLLLFLLTATFIIVLFIPQFASAQNNRLWATYYGGVSQEFGNSVATDAASNVYLAGATNSSTNIASGGFQDTLISVSQYDFNAFLVKFDANGNRLWATYYGQTNGSIGNSVATDHAGNVYLAGTTTDTIGIASAGFQNTYGGSSGGNAFLVKFDANGNRLWATYYGGANLTTGSGIATDADGNVYLTGTTTDTIGIASGGFQNTFGGAGGLNVYIVKFDANGNRLWATYYGTNFTVDGGVSNIATDIAGDVFLTGRTRDSIGIAAAGFQNTYGGVQDAFLVKFDANGNRLWATYYGGPNEDDGDAVATDTAGNVYMGGTTYSDTGIASPGAFQDTISRSKVIVGSRSTFLVKFDGDGNRLWATYYSGNFDDDCWGVATDANANVWLAGTTISTTGIASGGFQDIFYGYDGPAPFLVKFDANGNRQCATYYGTTRDKNTNNAALATDTAGNVYLTSTMHQPVNFPFNIAYDGFQDTCGGAIDAILVKFCPCTNCLNITPYFQASDTTFCGKACINYTDLSINIFSCQWSFPGGMPSSSIDQNPQGICYDSAGSYNVKLIVTDDQGNKDSLTFTNFITSLTPPPTPVITQHHDTLFCTTDPSYTSYQWYDSTTLIPGATDTFLIITHGGNYNVAVSNEYGCKISVGINISHDVGINEFSANNYISLSPNPASTQLTIHTSFSHISGSATISIMNVLGEIIQQENLKWSDDIIINIKTFPAGIYFLQMKTEIGIDSKGFVKE